MDKFTFLCIIAVVSAAPQGYNYHYPTNSITSGVLQESSSATSFTPSFAPVFNGGIQQQSSGATSGIVGLGHINQITTQTSGSTNHFSSQSHSKAPIVSKYFYLHSAPEETDEEVNKVIDVGQPRVTYKIVFIKAPAPSAKAAHVAISQAQAEEKTVIYVLSQKQDFTDIQTAVQDSPTNTNKPEVFFIKYKTAEEAVHAQKQIQAQYDSLGGETKFSDEGIAPISSVIGSLGETQGNLIGSSGSSVSSIVSNGPGNSITTGISSSISPGISNGVVGGISTTYLPPNK